MDHVELTRRGFEDFNRGDMEAVLAFLHPDVEVHNSEDVAPEAGTYRGRDEFLAWNRRWMEAWDEFRVELDEIEEVDEHNVLVHVRQLGRGRGSGLEAQQSLTYLFTLQDGLATRVHLYGDREAALAAARS